MKQHYISLLRIAQNKPSANASAAVKRAYKEARQVVSVALSIQANSVCRIGNTNFTDEVMSKVSNIVLCPVMIDGYCVYLNELLTRGV